MLHSSPSISSTNAIRCGLGIATAVKARALGRPGIGRWTFSLSPVTRSEEHTSELQSLMRMSYAVFCLKKRKITDRSHEQRERRAKKKRGRELDKAERKP